MKLLASGLICICVSVWAQDQARQAATPRLAFEVASIKVLPMGPNSFIIKKYQHLPPFIIPTDNRLKEIGHVEDLIRDAYGLNEYEISGLPGWALSPTGTVYDIEAKADGDRTPTPEQLQQMLQSLLTDRFQLKAHRESRANHSVLALVVGKDGPKFHEFHPPNPAPPLVPGGPRVFAGTTIFALLQFMARFADIPILDRTALPTSSYDFDIDKLLDFAELTRIQRTDRGAAQSYVFSAVRDKLGLKVESRKESMEVLVIDHVETPSPN